jgi:hypothetical protein
VRYADAGATSLNAITTTAARGTPANASIASANTGQTITIAGENFECRALGGPRKSVRIPTHEQGTIGALYAPERTDGLGDSQNMGFGE